MIDDTALQQLKLTSPRPRDGAPHSRWQGLFQAQAVPSAERHPREFFWHVVAHQLENRVDPQPLRILKVTTDLFQNTADLVEDSLRTSLQFTHIGANANAIAHGHGLLSAGAQAHDLVWSTGVFDACSDKDFVVVLQRLEALVKPGGSLVVGSFRPANPRPGLLGWAGRLRRTRSGAQLASLARKAGLVSPSIATESDAFGSTVFLFAPTARAGEAGSAA